MKKHGFFVPASPDLPTFALRACFENIPVGLAAGRGGWLRCSSVTDCSRICALVAPCHPPRRARNPFPDLLFSKHALGRINIPGGSIMVKSSDEQNGNLFKSKWL